VVIACRAEAVHLARPSVLENLGVLRKMWSAATRKIIRRSRFNADWARATELAENVRVAVSRNRSPGVKWLAGHRSIGIAVSNFGSMKLSGVEAEEALARAKHAGGNCVRVGGRG